MLLIRILSNKQNRLQNYNKFLKYTRISQKKRPEERALKNPS